MPSTLPRVLILVASLLLSSCDQRAAHDNTQGDVTPSSVVIAAPVDAARILNADATPGEWLSHGRTYSEQRFSPLQKINDKNVKELGLARGFHRIRHYGWMANANRVEKLSLARELLQVEPILTTGDLEQSPVLPTRPWICPTCAAPMIVIGIPERYHAPRAPPAGGRA